MAQERVVDEPSKWGSFLILEADDCHSLSFTLSTAVNPASYLDDGVKRCHISISGMGVDIDTGFDKLCADDISRCVFFFTQMPYPSKAINRAKICGKKCHGDSVPLLFMKYFVDLFRTSYGIKDQEVPARVVMIAAGNHSRKLVH